MFAALDSAARRQILLILHFRGDSMTAGEIADRFSCSWPTTSRHLRKLESAGLVEVERAGREWIYRLDRRRLRVAADWLDWFSAPRGAGVTVSVQPKSKRGPAVRPNRNRNTGT